MRYNVYQIQLTDEIIGRIRKNPSYDNVPEFQAKMLAMLGKPSLGLALNLYKKVAEIEATDLDDVFEIGNLGPESNITRLDSMSSISVGDIIELPDGSRYVVANIGFDPV